LHLTKQETRNKKNTITRTKEIKTKSTRRNLFSFKYIDTIIKVLRNSKYAIKRNNNCNKAKQKKKKKLKIKIFAAININI